jgi:hypothetical protein
VDGLPGDVAAELDQRLAVWQDLGLVLQVPVDLHVTCGYGYSTGPPSVALRLLNSSAGGKK